MPSVILDRALSKSRTHYTDSLESLQAEFRRRGWHRRATGIILAQMVFVTTLAVGGLAVFFLSPSWWGKLLGLILSTSGSLGVSTQAHTASHGTVSRSSLLDRFLTWLGFGVLLGLPVVYWRHKHIAVHHKAPNVDGFDQDIQLMPFFAMTQEEAGSGGWLARFYFRHVQWLVFPLAISLIAVNTQRTGWTYLARKMMRKGSRRAACWLDIFAGLLHLGLFLALPALFFPLEMVLLAHLLRTILLGYAMFAAFAPAHFPTEAVVADNSQRDADFALRQTATTVNFRTGPIGRLLCAGVEYQIEHHLFPNFSHVYYPAISPLVREFCERHGYPYRTLGWGEAIVKSLRVFACPKPIIKDLSEQVG